MINRITLPSKPKQGINIYHGAKEKGYIHLARDNVARRGHDTLSSRVLEDHRYLGTVF